MMKEDIEKYCIMESETIIDAMRTIERGGCGVALVLDDQKKLHGMLTDGNLRRALIAGATLESPLAPYVNRKFTYVEPDANRAHILDLMKARFITQIPIVDNNGHVLGLHLLHRIIGANPRPNWAVIMAGGKGTRLRPITEHLPKPMVLVAGRPILERLVLHLVGYGIRRIFLSINYLGNMIEKHFGDGQKYGCNIEYLRESQPLGTGGALSLLGELPSDPLLVLNGDLMTQFNIKLLFDTHQKGVHIATLGVSEYNHTVPYGCIKARKGRVIQFDEKPVLSRMINAGIYVLNPELLSRIPLNKEFPITSLFEDSIGRGESIGIYQLEDDWIDIGHHDQLKNARDGNVKVLT